MSAGVAIAVSSLIGLGVLAYAQYRVNRRFMLMLDQLLWFTRAVENHSASMVRLQKMRMGLPPDFF